MEGAEAEYLNTILNVRKDSCNAFLFGAFTFSEKLKKNLLKAKYSSLLEYKNSWAKL